MSLLTKEEALYFIENVLQVKDIPKSTIKDLPTEEKFNFLHTILSRFLETEPFQSITLMAVDLDKRRRPTWQEIKTDMFACRGGLCYSQNAFMFALLTAIGLDVSMTRATWPCAENQPNNHLCLLLHGLAFPDVDHLVDIGAGYSLPRVISLGFEKESPEFTDSFQTYKIAKESESKCVFNLKNKRSSRSNNTEPADDQDVEVKEGSSFRILPNKVDEWSVCYYFNPLDRYKDLEPLYPDFDNVFTDPTKLLFHRSPRCMHWPGGEFLGIVELEFITEDEEHTLIKKHVSQMVRSDDKANDTDIERAPLGECNNKRNVMDALVAMYDTYFPQFASGEVRAAIENWKAITNDTGRELNKVEHLCQEHLSNLALEDKHQASL
ncbi:arylamine N-acetyltransferase 1 [Biomphalaria glabrata]|nr:arylamine N-acetyltransferase 1 [Biomphalaria glabrata]